MIDGFADLLDPGTAAPFRFSHAVPLGALRVARASVHGRAVAVIAIDQGGKRGAIGITEADALAAVFDALVFGERESRKWLAGSDHYRRTRDLAGARESTGPLELVHLAVTYDGAGRIALYRNGAAYGESYVPEGDGGGGPVTYRAGEARVLIGLRHTGAGNGFLAGDIEEARLFDRALSPAEVQAGIGRRADPGDEPGQRPVAEHHAHPLADIAWRGGLADRGQVVEQPWQRHGQGDLKDVIGRHRVQCIGPFR